MKKITFIVTTAALALVFGLSACTDAEMANIERDIERQQAVQQNNQIMVDTQKDCKMYIVSKFSLPMAAVSVYQGSGSDALIYIPVSIKWDEPFVDERGECKVVNGRVVSYRRTSR